MRTFLIPGAVALALTALPASAQTATISYEVPRHTVSNYRKPYIAIWLEDADRKQVEVYSVAYKQSPIGDNWLPDLKTWWRRGGRAMKVPVSGVTRPTRGPGSYTIKTDSFGDLAPGSYALVVEAVREHGGREIVKVPFNWKKGAKLSASQKGSGELGAIRLSVAP